MITSDEAKRLKLSGSDTMVRTHSFYIDKNNKDYTVVYLNNEAYKILKDTILINDYIALRKEGELISKEFYENKITPCPLTKKYLGNFLLDYVKIALALELHLKSRILNEGYILHKINPKVNEKLKILKGLQDKRPIKLEEYFEADQYMYDEENRINRLFGLTDESIGFNKLLSESYVNCLNIKSDEITIINDIRKIRNTIHLPGDLPKSDYQNEDKIKKLINFINENIIDNTNIIISSHGFRYKLLDHFNYL